MTAMAARKSFSIHDYPEHLNPFHEDDNHNKIRFWTIGKRLSRSNSIKDLKNSWAFRSFMKKGKKSQQQKQQPATKQNGNGDSPIMFRRAMQYSSMSRSTMAYPERYVYGGSMTPLPRSRFQERLRSTSHYDTNSLSASPRMARSEVTGSRLSVASTNPFDEDDPVPPVKAARRKKKRIAPPPPATTADVSVSSETSELQISQNSDKKPNNDADIDLEEMNINIELKIVEDDDVTGAANKSLEKTNDGVTVEISSTTVISPAERIQDNGVHDKDECTKANENTTIKASGSDDDILKSVSFSKIDITKYRRNSSVNEDDIRLRRGNLEEFPPNTKRCKSLNNTSDETNFTTYDINLNEQARDANGNDEPQKVVCKLYDEAVRKQSVETISSTEKDFIEIDRATRELEREISKLNSALNDEDLPGGRLSVSDMKKKFDGNGNDTSSPNPIPKPRRSNYGGSP